MKIPNLASSYHVGIGLESSDSQDGSYLVALISAKWLVQTKTKANVIIENILTPKKVKNRLEETSSRAESAEYSTGHPDVV